MKAPDPPRRLEWLVTVVTAPSPHADSIAGDLREDFVRRAAESPRAARAWYRRQALSLAWSYLPALPRHLWRAVRAEYGDPFRTVLADDVRRSLRSLRRRPGLTAILLSTLALGIGMNAVIFAVVRGVLLKPLAYPDPERVVTIWSTNRARGWTRGGVSRQDADDWAAATRAFDAIGTYTAIEANARVAGRSERVRVVLASSGAFRALRVAPTIGRTLLPADDAVIGASVAVLSHAFWVRALGADPAAVGRIITLDGQPLTVVGVMPASFDLPDASTAVWKAFGAPPDATGSRDARWVNAVGRLRTAVALETAEAELTTVAERLSREYPASNRDVGVYIEPLLRAETGDVRPLLLVAWGMVALVLVIVATNIANLQLARAAEREGEVAVRAALGAARTVLARQFLVESVLLGLFGGILGAALAAATLPFVKRVEGIGLPRLDGLALDPWVILYSISISLAVGIAFGVAPALGAAQTQPALALRRAGRGSVTRTRERLRSTLIVAQVAVATVVLIAAGLLLRSFDLLSRVEPGFSLEQRVTFRLAPDWATYPKRERARVLYDTFLEKLAATPGTISVAAVNRLPLTGSWWTTQYEIAERPAEPGREPTAIYRVITSDYFSTMGISLVSGRGIENTDRADVRPVVVVSRALAERGWPGASPLGRRITFQPGDSTAVWYTVVGIVSDVRTSGLADEPAPMAYVSFAQAGFGHFSDWGMDVVVHTRSAQSAVIVAARRTLEALAPGIPLFEPRPLTDLVARDLARRRFLVLLLGVFAATAMTLAGLGLYGVVAYGVAQRRGELGLRMALGAGSVQVWRSVVARSLALAALGVAGGVPAAAVAGRLMTALLYGVTPLDPATFVAVSGAVLLIAGVAGGVPAFRASHVSPMEALRND